ncbi:MAG: CBS domain-containing protein [Planctomycetales bacterium]|nr:CBS domain-containing protein [Planctomycetales bacterium]
MDFQLHLETESVEQAHPTKPVCVLPEDSIRHVMRVLKTSSTGAAMVCRDGKLEGIFTERDALRLLADGSDLEIPVSTVMVKNPVSIRTGNSVGEAISLMSSGKFRQLPIVDGAGHVTGIVGAAGVLRYLVEHFPRIIYTLPPSPHHKMETKDGG